MMIMLILLSMLYGMLLTMLSYTLIERSGLFVFNITHIVYIGILACLPVLFTMMSYEEGSKDKSLKINKFFWLIRK